MNQSQLDFTQQASKPKSTSTGQNALVKNYLMARFGEWVDAWTLFELDKIRALNSRIANVRAEIEAQGLDVDSRCTDSFKQHWDYRICKIEHSERLKRERNREAKHE